MNNYRTPIIRALFNILLLLIVFYSLPSLGTVESSLIGLKKTLSNVILPALSVMGLVCSAISLYTGNPNAKTHILYAVFGCIVGFGAQSIVELIQHTVQ